MLKIGGVFSFAVALLHILVVLIGLPAYHILGGVGDDLAELLEIGSFWPTLITLSIAGVFAIFGCYAFSGAGTIRRLPFLCPGLVTIACVYLLRGFINIPYYWLILMRQSDVVSIRTLLFDAIVLTIGFTYAFGTAKNWDGLKIKVGIGDG